MDKKSNFKGISHKKESKECATCNKLFFNNKTYESRGLWASVKYCSAICRKNKNRENITKFSK